MKKVQRNSVVSRWRKWRDIHVTTKVVFSGKMEIEGQCGLSI